MTIQVVTPVSFTVEYADAPIDKVGVIEVHVAKQLQGLLGEGQQADGLHVAVGPAIEPQALGPPRRALQSSREVL